MIDTVSGLLRRAGSTRRGFLKACGLGAAALGLGGDPMSRPARARDSFFTTPYQGATVAYRTDGAGPALVLVHGTGGDARSNWDGMVGRLSQEWTVIRPDYAGSGDTRDDGRPLTTPYLAGQVIAAAQAAGAERFHLMGYSLGAGVAVEIAGTQPEKVASLTLLAGMASGADARLRLEFELWRDLIRTDRRAMARLILLTGFSPDALSGMGEAAVRQAVEDILSGVNWEGMARQTALDLTIDVEDRLDHIAAPTLVLGCTHDHMVPPAHARHLAERIAGAQYADLPTGHLAPMEAPDAVVDAVSAFLRRQSL